MNSAIKKYRDFSPVAAIKSAIKTILGLIGDLVKSIAMTLADLGRSAVKTVSDPRMATPLLILVLANMKKIREILSRIRNKVNETKSEAKNKEEWEVIFGNGPTYEKQHAERMKNVTNKASKQAEKEARKAAKQAEKAAREAAKQAEKKAKEASKEAERQKKQAEKEAKEQAKQAAKQAKEALKLTGNTVNTKKLTSFLRSDFENKPKELRGRIRDLNSYLPIELKDNVNFFKEEIRSQILKLNVSDEIKSKYTKNMLKLSNDFRSAIKSENDSIRKLLDLCEQHLSDDLELLKRDYPSKDKNDYSQKSLIRALDNVIIKRHNEFVNIYRLNLANKAKIRDKYYALLDSLVDKANNEERKLRKKAEKIAKEAAKIEKKAESIKKKLDPSVKQTLGEAGKNIVKEVGSAVAKTVIGSAGSAVIGAIGASKQKNKKAIGGPKQLSLFGDAKSLKQKIRRLKDARCL